MSRSILSLFSRILNHRPVRWRWFRRAWGDVWSLRRTHVSFEFSMIPVPALFWECPSYAIYEGIEEEVENMQVILVENYALPPARTLPN